MSPVPISIRSASVPIPPSARSSPPVDQSPCPGNCWTPPAASWREAGRHPSAPIPPRATRFIRSTSAISGRPALIACASMVVPAMSSRSDPTCIARWRALRSISSTSSAPGSRSMRALRGPANGRVQPDTRRRSSPVSRAPTWRGQSGPAVPTGWTSPAAGMMRATRANMSSMAASRCGCCKIFMRSIRARRPSLTAAPPCRRQGTASTTFWTKPAGKCASCCRCKCRRDRRWPCPSGIRGVDRTD